MDGRTVVIQQPTTTAVAVQSNAPGAKTVTATRGLGITQIILGSLTILFGIIATAVLHYWVGSVGFGIWGGIWILIGGILGVVSAGNPSNGCISGTNMAFAIVSCVVSFIQFIFYCVAVTYYRHFYRVCHYWSCTRTAHATGVALYVILLLLMIAEFAIAMTVAIYCCKMNNCCGSTGAPTPVVFQQAQPVVFQSGGVTPSTYPVAYPGQQVSYVSTVPQNTTVVTYSQQPYGQQAFAQQPYGLQPFNQEKDAMSAPPPYAQ